MKTPKIENKPPFTFPLMLKNTITNYGNAHAFGFVGEKPLTYEEVGKKVRAVMAMLETFEIRKGDKVAILSHNMPNWGIVYFAVTSMGAIAVPILHEFSIPEIENIIAHSDSKLLFVSHALKSKVNNIESYIPKIAIDDFQVLSANISCLFNPDSEPTSSYDVHETDLASIVYTSGTTGKSKGVMLSHRNICFTAYGGSLIQPIDENDRFLSVLPLSHTYENTLGLILPVMFGSAVWYLKKPPTAPVLLPALEEIKPTMMLTVPLIMEKIYFSKILPAFNDKAVMRTLYKVAPIRKILNRIAGKKLKKTFGGHLKFFGIGGAKLNKVVEKFLLEAKFPYAIGYGLTETSPLLAGAPPKNALLESTGPAMNGVTLKINNPNPKTGEGEIWAKGDNVMQGYYKMPEATKDVLNPDGWLKTGDLGYIDNNSNLFIKSRLKNMIVGAGGENIYPEDIETVINNYKNVVESLVVEQKGKLVAMVHLNMEELGQKYNNFKDGFARKYDDIVNETLSDLKEYVNSRVAKSSRIQIVVFKPEPFHKTATMKVKRFLYK
ncbi:MAG: AMP-binding protein [Bacteroidales bacterium]|nr:AMP-binding protein [Bacteroidales bacterium]